MTPYHREDVWAIVRFIAWIAVVFVALVFWFSCAPGADDDGLPSRRLSTTPPVVGRETGNLALEGESAPATAKWAQTATVAGTGTYQEQATPPPRGAQEGGTLLSQLDALEARIAALDHGPGLGAELETACGVCGVEWASVRRGEVEGRCRRVPNLGVVKIARAP